MTLFPESTEFLKFIENLELIANDTRKEFIYLKHEGKWYWQDRGSVEDTNRHGPYDTRYLALADAVEPYLEGETGDEDEDDWRLKLRKGDEITWNDPDDGICSRTGIIGAIEYPSEGIARVTWQDGGTTEMKISEIS